MKRAISSVSRRLWVAYPLLLLVAMLTWVISSPVGSSPDEDFHLTNTWCAQGFRSGYCEPGSKPLTRLVPAEVGTIACFAFKPAQSGNCPSQVGQMAETDRWNYNALYPEGFYLAMSVFVSPSVTWSVLAMRATNALIYVVGMAFLLLLADPRRRAAYMLGSLVTLIPLAVFVVASVNPSGWAVTSATLVWSSAFEFFQATEKRKKIGLGVLCAFALGLAFACRADAAAYAGLALGLAWLATARFSRRTLIYGAIVAIFGALALLWIRFLRSALVAIPGSLTASGGLQGLLRRVLDLPEFYAGAFGARGLGWLDTAMPWVTWILAGAAYAAAIFWGMRRCGWRKAVSLLLIVAVASAVPVMMVTERNAAVASLQPRYFLPLIVLAAMVALADDNLEGPELNLAQCLMLVTTVAASQAVALKTNLRRYITGLDNLSFKLNADVEWWWTWAPSPMVVLGIGSVAFLGAATVAVVAALRSAAPIASLSE